MTPISGAKAKASVIAAAVARAPCGLWATSRTMAGERQSAAEVVLVRARDGYAVAFSVGELRANRANPRVFLVSETAMDPLPENEGPVRLIVLGDPVRSAYGLATIELKVLADNKR